MINPKIKTKVVHSQTKEAYNIVGTTIGCKYKIARVPYLVTDNKDVNVREQMEALQHAEFISFCFNHSDEILKFIKNS